MHLKVHAQTFECHQCEKKFPRQNHLSNHLRKHARQSLALTVTESPSTLNNEMPLASRNSHMNQVPESARLSSAVIPNSARLFSCEFCSKSFSLKNNLNSHLKMHTQPNSLKCHLCDQKFTFIQNLNVHLRLHLGVKPFACDKCGMKFAQKSYLKIHMSTHSHSSASSGGPSTEMPLDNNEMVRNKAQAKIRPRKTLVVTGKKSTLSQKFVARLRTQNGVKRFPCDICGSKFTRSFNLKVHLRKHNTRDNSILPPPTPPAIQTSCEIAQIPTETSLETPFSCEFCGKCFRIKQVLNAHLKIHTHANSVACEKCDKKFTYRQNYLAHFAKYHAGAQQFIVANRDLPQTQKSVKNPTQQSSLSKEPFACDRCGKVFKYKQTLQIHTRSHTGETPFACDMCEQKFTHKSNLDYHMRCHTGERFGCHKCDKSFTSKQYLMVHLASVH